MSSRTALLFAAFICSSCLPKPQKDYTPDEVASINDLKELMRVQAHHADPQFAKRDQQSFTKQELAEIEETGKMLQATSSRIKDFGGKGKFDDGFANFAGQLNQNAQALEQAAKAGDAAKVRDALGKVRTTCQSCHSEYR
jgi:cytochrome c556